MLTDIKSVFDALGGLKAVAELTGRDVEAVRHWPKKGKFPAQTYLAMLRALARRGHTAPPSLWGQSEPAQ